MKKLTLKTFEYIITISFFLLIIIFTLVNLAQPKVTLLSFDTETPDSSQVMLDLIHLLDKHDIKATFFVTIEFVEENPFILQKLIDENHEIACHTINHPYLPLLDEKEQTKEIIGCKNYLKNNYDIDVIGFRAPYRQLTKKTYQILNQTDYLYDASIFTNYDFLYSKTIIKEIYTTTLFMIPMDDYLCMNILNFSPKIYFWLINNNFKNYRSYSFHPHIIMSYPDKFDDFLESLKYTQTHKYYLES